MKLIDLLDVFDNYDNFNIVVDNDNINGLESVFKINEDTPLEFISDKLLNAEVISIYVDEDFKKNRNDLFLIEIEQI